MSEKILVAYASRYGSTREVAESVADTLRQSGCAVDVSAMKDVSSLQSYDTVVMGAPLFIGQWHKDARAFLAEHQDAIIQRIVAVFALGPLGTSAEEMQGSRGQFEQELAKYPWLKPVSVEVFVGKYSPDVLSFPHKMIAVLPASPLSGLPASDNRDWAAIQTWAGALLEKV